MSFVVILTEGGNLVLEEDSSSDVHLSSKQKTELKVSFARGREQALLCLVGVFLEEKLPESLAWWREGAMSCVERFCQVLGEEAPLWSPQDGKQWIERRPWKHERVPFEVAQVKPVWEAFSQYLFQKSRQSSQGIRSFLTNLNPFWADLGRVIFHLAEHPLDQERPFVFLVTYAETSTQENKEPFPPKRMQRTVKHRPLGMALQSGVEDLHTLKSLLLPLQRACEQSKWIAHLLESGQMLRAQQWTVSEAYRFLRATMALKNSGVVLRLPDWWKESKGNRPQVMVSLEEDTKRKEGVGMAAMLRFSVRIALGQETLSEEEVSALMAEGDPLVRVKGKWVEVDRKMLKEVLIHWQKIEALQGTDRSGVGFMEGMRWISGFERTLQGSPLTAGLTEEATEWFSVQAGERLANKLAQMHSQSLEEDSGKYLTVPLRSYQEHGVQWLRSLGRWGMGACLADDMGLGKTIQTIGYLSWVHLAGECRSEKKPSLLVVPASLLGNWKRELARFCPALKTMIVHRSYAEAWELNAFYRNPQERIHAKNWDLVITTYALATQRECFRQMSWKVLIVDEAQALKNPMAEKTRAMKAFQSESRVALSGTPLENNLMDLWSLFDFLNPGLLGSAQGFAQAVKRMQLQGKDGQVNYAPLRRVIQPYLLRRLKTDRSIAAELPEKTERSVQILLSEEQVRLYQQGVQELEACLNQEHPEVEGAEYQRSIQGEVLSFLMRFKQICNHPALWLGDQDYAVSRSGKLQQLEKLAKSAQMNGEKMVVFTQFKEMCAPLANLLSEVFSKQGCVLHGSTKIKQRQAMVDDFNQSGAETPPFFVVSLKAGGTGLNLTAAHHVVHFDRWWNPAVENQATDRVYRIGQRHAVLVHKFVSQGTVEEKIERLILSKVQLVEDLFLDEDKGQDGDLEYRSSSRSLGASRSLMELSPPEILELMSLDLNQALED